MIMKRYENCESDKPRDTKKVSKLAPKIISGITMGAMTKAETRPRPRNLYLTIPIEVMVPSKPDTRIADKPINRLFLIAATNLTSWKSAMYHLIVKPGGGKVAITSGENDIKMMNRAGVRMNP
jgi:hypothetical protein